MDVTLLKISELVELKGLHLWLVGLLCLSGCAGFQKGKRLGDVVSRHDVIVSIDTQPTDSIRFYYSGCAGFFIQRGSDAVLNDPFLSNNGPVTALTFRRLVPNSARLATYSQRILGSSTDKTGLVKILTATHTHFDHVYDVPALYHRHLNRDSLLLIGSESFRRLMSASAKEYHQPIGALRAVDSLVSSVDTLRSWIYSNNGRVRVLPIRSNHAPHFFGIKFYKGTIRQDLSQLPVCASDYREGLSLAYLIDFLNSQGEPDFRIYLEGSANQVPLGLPPPIADHKAVDVAILCVASYEYVNQHPEATLNYLKPRFVILSHWENFFQPGLAIESRPAVVPFTNMQKFLRRFRHYYTGNNWVLPQPGIWINVRF